jgi:hypothetical protein
LKFQREKTKLQLDRISLETYLGGEHRRWSAPAIFPRRPQKIRFGTSGRGAQRHAVGGVFIFWQYFPMIFYPKEFFKRGL